MTRTRNLVISFIGTDRPGLVRRITDVVTRHHGNWQESSMRANRFAGIAIVAVADENFAELKHQLENIDDIAMLVEAAGQEATQEPTQALRQQKIRLLKLNIIGPDRPGILHDVTLALEKNVINVTQMETRVSHAAMSGEVTFSADASIEIPLAMDLDDIGAQLDQVADNLGVDILLDDESDQ